MKKLFFLLIIIIVTGVTGYSQIINDATEKKLTTGIDIYTNIWLDLPDGIKQGAVNPGLSFFVLYDFQLGDKNLFFSPGLAISTHTLHHNGLFVVDTNNNTQFPVFNDVHPDINYNTNRLSLTYVDIPLEFWFNGKNGVKFAAGFKVGFLLQSTIKYSGDDYLYETNNNLKFKLYKIRNIDPYRYGLILRGGWKWLNLYGYYSLSNVFVKGAGPEMFPLSVGATIRPLKSWQKKKK